MPLPRRKNVTLKEISEWLAYEPTTGVVTWVRVPRKYGIVLGGEAGMIIPTGYRVVVFRRKHYLAHHLAWLFATGEWPLLEIDHKNGVRSDNRLCNLRQATSEQQSYNRRVHRTNKEGLKGVCWHAARKKYIAQINVDRKRKTLGYFTSREEAHEAYMRAADQTYGPFSNYGGLG